ncbi:MAG: hypothetical protein R3A79_09775 [Nannocystaceae bacterium]
MVTSWPLRAGEPAPAEAPADPNDAPMLRPPNGQPAPTPLKRAPALEPPYSGDRRLAITLAPAYASFRLPLLGRPTARRPGAGALIEADLRLLSFIWLRAQLSYSSHPLDKTTVADEETGDPITTANSGVLHATSAGIGVAAGIDLGRFLPTVDVGAGLFRLGTPEGALAGQRGRACIDGSVCDTGLTCRAGTCVPAAVPEIHGGVSVDLMLRKHWYIGATIRYFALMVQPLEIPIYVIGAARFGARF